MGLAVSNRSWRNLRGIRRPPVPSGCSDGCVPAPPVALGGVEVPRSDRLPAPDSLLVVAAITAVITGLCIVTIDQPIARWIGGYARLELWDRVLDGLEWALLLPVHKYASMFVLAIGLLATMAVPRWRDQAAVWMYFAGVHIISRFAMNHLKVETGRLRPSEWLAKGGDTFWRDDGFSFPSGHVVLFASVVIPAAVIWPRTRPLLAIVGFVMIARLAVNAHFVSDVIGAITLVTLVSWGLGALVRPLTRSRPRACR